jgi:hypothetical protein
MRSAGSLLFMTFSRMAALAISSSFVESSGDFAGLSFRKAFQEA